MENFSQIRQEIDNMENTSGVTADSLKASIIDKLEATHVEISDMSGRCRITYV